MILRLLRIVTISILILILFIFSIVFGILFTDVGTKLVWDQAKGYVDGLDGELISGNFGNGINFNKLSFKMEGFDLAIEELSSKWDLLTLIYGRFDLKDLRVKGLKMNIPIAPTATDPIYDQFFYKKVSALWHDQDASKLDLEQQEKQLSEIALNNLNNEFAKSKPWYIEIPLLINADHILVEDFSLDTDLFNLVAKSIDAKTQLYKHTLTKTSLIAEDLDFELKDLNSPAYRSFSSLKIEDGFNKEELNQKLATMAPVFIPFVIDVERLELIHSRYHQSSYDTQYLSSVIKGKIEDYNIDLEPSTIDSEQYGKIEISGHVGLKDHLDLDLVSKGDLNYRVMDDLVLNFPFDLTTKGDLTDLAIKLLTHDQHSLDVTSRINLVDGNLTNDSIIKYKKLEWPYNKQDPDHSLKKGTIKYKGTLSQINLDLDSEVATKYLKNKKLSLKGAVDGTLEDLNIDHLNIAAGAKDQLALSGHVTHKNDLIKIDNLDLALEGKISNILTDEVVDQLNGQLHADASYNLERNDLDFNIPKLALNGTILKYPININAKSDGFVPINDPLKLDVNIDHLDFEVYKNTLHAKGCISDQKNNDFKAELKFDHLNELTKLFLATPIEGYLNANLSLLGKPNAPELKLDASTDHLAMQDQFAFNNLTLKIDEKINFDQLNFNGLTLLKIRDSSVAGNDLKNIILKLDGNQDLHKLILWIQKDEKTAFSFKEAGSLKHKNDYHAHFEHLEINTPFGDWNQKQPLDLDYKIDKKLLTFSPFNILNNDQSISMKKGFFNLDDFSSDLHLQLKRFNLGFVNKYMPQDTMLLATLNASVDVTSKPHKNFVVGANIYSKNGIFRGVEQTTTYNKLNLDFNISEEQKANIKLTLDADDYGKLAVITDYNLKDPSAKFGRNTKISFDNFDVGLFNPFVNSLDELKAILNGEGVVDLDDRSGVMFVNGKFDLTEGEIITQTDIANVNNLHFDIVSNHDQVTLNGGFNLGEGKGDLKGNIDLRPLYNSGIPKGEINLLLDRATVNLAGFGSAIVDSSFKLLFKESKEDPSAIITYLKGLIKIPSAKIEVVNVADSGVALSEDVEVITTKSEDETAQKELPQSPSNFLFDMNISVGPYISVSAYGLKSGLVGKLVVNNTTNEDHSLDARGKITLTDGRFRSFGQNLIIRNGEILFDGLISNPSIKFEAIRDPETINDNSGVIAGLRVFGTPLKMDLKVFSEPEMSEAEKLSYLLKGTGLSEDASSNSAAAASMLLGASLGSASNSMQDLTNAIGLNDFQLESTGSGDSSAVQASFYLTKKLKVSYGYGLVDSIMQLKLRYELMKKLYVQYLNGNEQAVDLFYTFNFD